MSVLGARADLEIVKLPFPLTIRFKSMLQSGVMTRDLDVRWVSSLSWYFLNLFGLQSVFGFILGSDNGEFSNFTQSHNPVRFWTGFFQIY